MHRMTLARWALGLNLALLLGLALWFRVTSLAAMPEVIGDEYLESIKLSHWVSGKAVRFLVPSGNPINPLLGPAWVVLHHLHAPAPWLVRLPAACCGVLAVVLTYTLGARILDRPTALIASGLMAVLPIAIIFSRIGYGATLTPLLSLLVLYFAFRGRRGATVLAFLAAFVVQPTNVFLLPVVFAVYLVQECVRTPREPARLRRRLVELAVTALVVVVGAGVATLQRRYVRSVYSHWGFGDVNVFRFLKYYGRLLLGEVLLRAPRPALHLQDALFWGVVGPVLVLGTWRLVCTRRWDRLALLAGLALGGAGLLVVAGAHAIRPEMPRYGMYLVMPSVLAFACLLRSLLVTAPGVRPALLRGAQCTALLGLGWTLLWATKTNWFDFYTSTSGESLWTFRTETPDPNQRVLALVARDVEAVGRAPAVLGRSQAPPARALLITENWWTYGPLQYLTLTRPDIKVVAYEQMGLDLQQHSAHLRANLERGAYAVGFSGGRFEALITQWFAPERLERWDIPHNDGDYFFNGSRTLAVFRLKPAAPARAETVAEAAFSSQRR